MVRRHAHQIESSPLKRIRIFGTSYQNIGWDAASARWMIADRGVQRANGQISLADYLAHFIIQIIAIPGGIDRGLDAPGRYDHTGK